MKILLSFIVFFAIASVCYAGRIASISQVQDNQCVDVDLDTYYFCSPCTVNGETFYYSLFESDFLYYSDKFNDSNCYYYKERNIVHEDQSCAPTSHNLCEFYVKTTAFTYFELDISSSTPISATFFARKFESTISQTSLVARGDQLDSLIVQNEDYLFRYEKRVSPTQYSSTLGVFSFGEVYSQNNFKFSVSLVVLPGNPSQHISPVLVVFYPFSTIAVTEEDAEYHFLTTSHGGEFIISTDQTYSLTGLSLTNYLYGVQNMTLFPEFELNNEYHNGNIVVQVGDENPFITFPCYLSTSIIRGNSVDIYDCEFESYSFSYGGSWGGSFSGWSFDEHGLPKDREHRPDQMAFSLF